MSSRAAIADPGESLKKVRTTCWSAERLASSGFAAGKVDVARAVVLAAQQAALDHDLEQLPHARRARRVRQLRADFFDRGALTAMQDFHDLAFAAGQMDVALVFSRGLRWAANFFAHSEYIRLTEGCQVVPRERRLRTLPPNLR